MKHLVYLCDGTWMFPGDNKSTSTFTNIHRINDRLAFVDRVNNEQQIVYYSRGLGSGQTYIKWPQGILGWGIWNAIEELYLNICSNYDPDEVDLLYFFGFSRGCIVARVVTGLLSYGVLRPQSFDYVKEIRDLYLFDSKKNRGIALSEEDFAHYASLQSKLEGKCYPKKPQIEFLGLFDSVIGGKKYIKTWQELNVVDSRPSGNVKATVQILSLDEQRAVFHPSWFKLPPRTDGSCLEQIWFPGIHSDIGGGSKNVDLPKIALLTMIDRVLFHTKLNIRYKDLSDVYCKKFEEKLVIESEWSLIWRIVCLFRSYKRVPAGAQHSVHPLVDYLSQNKHIYKSEALFSSPRPNFPPNLERTVSFISEELRHLKLLPRDEENSLLPPLTHPS